MSACAAGKSAKSVPPNKQSTQSPTAPPNLLQSPDAFYMYTNPDVVEGLRVSNSNGQLGGFYLSNISFPDSAVKSWTYTVTGTLQGTSVTLNARNSERAPNGITTIGQLLPNSDLQMTAAGTNGQVSTSTLKPSLVEQYNVAVSALEAAHPSPSS